MNKLTKLLIAAIIVLVLISGFAIRKLQIVKAEKQRISNNLYTKTQAFALDRGTWAYQKSVLVATQQELRQANSEQAGEYEQQLSTAYRTIKDLKLKLKNVEEVVQGEYEATGTDTIYITKKDSSYILTPVDDGFLKGGFKPIQYITYDVFTSYVFDYIYSDSISVVKYVDKLKFSEKHGGFLRKLFIRQYRTRVISTAKNPRAKYDVNLIEVK